MAETVVVTGGSGFVVGQLLRAGLSDHGFHVDTFDLFKGPLINLVRRRYLATVQGQRSQRAARRIRNGQVGMERVLKRTRLLRPSADDILGPPAELAARFAGNDAVIHLAGIPHPYWPGATEADFARINYEAAVNVFEATRAAEVPVFVFASSAQVYRINDPVRLDQFPILETNHLPLPAEGQTTYGFLKAAFERFLAGTTMDGPTRAVSLRLEFPGFRSTSPDNLYISTSYDNLVGGFVCAVRAPQTLRFGVYNLADAEVDESVVDIQSFLRHRWPYVPNHTVGNACLLSTEKAVRELGYSPVARGRYLNANLVW